MILTGSSDLRFPFCERAALPLFEKAPMAAECP
jgi:hypothetical protein